MGLDLLIIAANDCDADSQFLGPGLCPGEVDDCLDVFEPFVELVDIGKAQVDGLVLVLGNAVDGLENEGEVLVVLALAVDVVVEVVLFHLVGSLQLDAQLSAIDAQDLLLPASQPVPLDVDFGLLGAVERRVEGLESAIHQLLESLDLGTVQLHLLLAAQGGEGIGVLLGQELLSLLGLGLILGDLVVVLPDDCLLVFEHLVDPGRQLQLVSFFLGSHELQEQCVFLHHRE